MKKPKLKPNSKFHNRPTLVSGTNCTMKDIERKLSNIDPNETARNRNQTQDLTMGSPSPTEISSRTNCQPEIGQRNLRTDAQFADQKFGCTI